jgi:hypothetical protein
MKRRTMLIGLGSVIAGGGAVLGTGAFTQVQADRSVSVNVAEDSTALVGIEVNDRYGGQTDDGVAEFDLQSNLFEDTGFNPDGTTILYSALAITNNRGNSGDEMEVLLSYGSDSVDVPGGEEVPDRSAEGQFSFRAFDSDDAPDSPFEGLTFDGDPEDVGDPGSLAVGETAIFDLVVAPGGELDQDEDYAVDVTITANIIAGGS